MTSEAKVLFSVSVLLAANRGFCSLLRPRHGLTPHSPLFVLSTIASWVGGESPETSCNSATLKLNGNLPHKVWGVENQREQPFTVFKAMKWGKK
ncbi:uncharacterized protein UTRI_02047 [Ustilago trichophora]|uniref:Uncharacterized protein n=1 Tax=Ustilago trichophora TaxID=86804 RepID=A0A5C3E1P4_9BASI|nr:uncharacterized protein UTRI_02047 [Ustilago trichophora]